MQQYTVSNAIILVHEHRKDSYLILGLDSVAEACT